MENKGFKFLKEMLGDSFINNEMLIDIYSANLIDMNRQNKLIESIKLIENKQKCLIDDIHKAIKANMDKPKFKFFDAKGQKFTSLSDFTSSVISQHIKFNDFFISHGAFVDGVTQHIDKLDLSINDELDKGSCEDKIEMLCELGAKLCNIKYKLINIENNLYNQLFKLDELVIKLSEMTELADINELNYIEHLKVGVLNCIEEAKGKAVNNQKVDELDSIYREEPIFVDEPAFIEKSMFALLNTQVE